MLTVRYQGRDYAVASVQDAASKWEEFRDAALRAGGDYDSVGGGLAVRDGRRTVARVRYNGSVRLLDRRGGSS